METAFSMQCKPVFFRGRLRKTIALVQMPVNPPRPKAPPLNALRAFEAAARLGGFARAAEELLVSPGAVSQQVRLLEDWAGLPLFERRAQGVELTEAGRAVHPDLVAAFDAVGRAAQKLRARGSQPLLIAALPSVAQLWLMPRLAKLRRALPGHAISVTALETAPNLLREPFSLALFLLPRGQGAEIVQDALVPVCAPELAIRVRSPDDLMQLPCLTDTSWSADWDLWWRQAGSHQTFVPLGPRYSLYAMAVEDALAGAGILMGHTALLQPHLNAGRLVAPLPIEVDNGLSLAALVPPGAASETLAELLSAL